MLATLLKQQSDASPFPLFERAATIPCRLFLNVGPVIGIIGILVDNFLGQSLDFLPWEAARENVKLPCVPEERTHGRRCAEERAHSPSDFHPVHAEALPSA